MILGQFQCLIVTLVLGTMVLEGVFAGLGVADVIRSKDESMRDPGTYIIHFEENTTDAQLQIFVKQLLTMSTQRAEEGFKVDVIAEYFGSDLLTAKLSENALHWVTLHDLVMEVKENEFILLASEPAVSHTGLPPWHLDRIDQHSLPLDNKFTASQYTGKSVDVYVLDTGIHYNHSAFNGRAQFPGCDPLDKLNNEAQKGEDCNGHGTHVAGLIGGNGTGLATSVTLFSVRVANCRGSGSTASMLDGLMCVQEHRKSRNGTRAIVNMSFSGSEKLFGVDTLISKLIADGVTLTAAAGNGGIHFNRVHYNSCNAYPAGYFGIINVAATDMDDNAVMGEYEGRPVITNIGPCVDLFAPGYGILSSDICLPNALCYKLGSDINETFSIGEDECSKCLMYRTGTSQSTALVSGAVALLLEKCPSITNTEIRNMLRTFLSRGRVKFCRAFDLVRNWSQFNNVIGNVPAVNDVIGNTSNRLLHVGAVLPFVGCEMFHDQPLITDRVIKY